MALSAVFFFFFCPVAFLVTSLSYLERTLTPDPHVLWEDGGIKRLGGFSFVSHLVVALAMVTFCAAI